MIATRNVIIVADIRSPKNQSTQHSIRTMKIYRVTIDMVWSIQKDVKAKNASEAKKKAWSKFKNRLPKKDFSIDADTL